MLEVGSVVNQNEKKKFEFEGVIIVPDTDVYPAEITPDGTEQTVTFASTTALIHAIYVSHDNPTTIKLTLKSPTKIGGKTLTFMGYFGNNVRPVHFSPPIGEFKDGKVILKAEGSGATEPVIVNIQYSEVVE